MGKRKKMDEAETSDKRPYRRGVGVVLFNAEGKVFAAQRNDMPGEAWQLPQGGIDAGESPLEAALRELKEETGVTSVELLAETDRWLSYDLPEDLARKAWRGRYRGQTQKWFALRFTGENSEVDLNHHSPEFTTWRWSDLASLPTLIVPFKRDLYRALVEEFRRFARPQGS